MLNKKMNIILLFLFIFLIGCDKKESVKKEKKNNLENIQSKTAKENIFSNNSIEKIIETFSKKSKENKISIENFEKLYGRKADRKRKLFNGRIKVDFYQFYGPKPK